mmetsp:Transcript_58354/g.136969  ORF Transcript_58354/g.136969 Transcript_58354/m.136969 type:complete len:341 (+) Transcript_58354:682-1704(+)
MLSIPASVTGRSRSEMSTTAFFLCSSSASSSALSWPRSAPSADTGNPDKFSRLLPICLMLNESVEKIRNFFAGLAGCAAVCSAGAPAGTYSTLLGGVSACSLPPVRPGSASTSIWSDPTPSALSELCSPTLACALLRLESESSSSVPWLLLPGFSDLRLDMSKLGRNDTSRAPRASLADDTSESDLEVEADSELSASELLSPSRSSRILERSRSAFCFSISLFSRLMSLTTRFRPRFRAPPARAANCPATLLFRSFFFSDCLGWADCFAPRSSSDFGFSSSCSSLNANSASLTAGIRAGTSFPESWITAGDVEFGTAGVKPDGAVGLAVETIDAFKLALE